MTNEFAAKAISRLPQAAKDEIRHAFDHAYAEGYVKAMNDAREAIARLRPTLPSGERVGDETPQVP